MKLETYHQYLESASFITDLNAKHLVETLLEEVYDLSKKVEDLQDISHVH